MSDYTPGPWRYEEFGPNVIIKATKNPMLAVVHSLYHESREQREANAHLIAAAPELLEALEYYAEKVADLNRYGVVIETSLRELELDLGSKARAAITKATGVLAEGDSEGE